jgi:hypothetical protein
MSDEFQSVASSVNSLFTIVVLLFATYRVGGMERGFVDPIYRSKARWSAALMVVIVISSVTNFLPLPSSGVLSELGFVPFIAIILVSFGFVDRTITIAIRTDFFHRDTIGWSRARIPSAVLLVIFCGLALIVGGINNPTGSVLFWATGIFDGFFTVVIVVLAYASVALVVGARRTPDKTLKRHVLLLGMALACFVLSIAFFLGPSSSDVVALGSDLVSILATVFLYASVMRLTVLGRVEKLQVMTPSDGKTLGSQA